MPRTDLSIFLKTEDNRFRVHFTNRTPGTARKRNKLFFSKFGPHGSPVAEPIPDAQAVSDEESLVFVDSLCGAQTPRDTRVGAKRRGPAPQCLSNETFFCHRNGPPTESKRDNVRHGNIHCNCTAKIKISCSEQDPLNATVTYYWRHEGHVPGSLDDLISAPLPLPVKEALATLVDESLTWRNIKNAIRVDR
ncbi:hypothetical protein BC940DRAFT_351378 [Gongronella butleri]|nr:hypothetical protein BC940DRAFT_351378 [Gongronella butleri]